MRSVPMLCALLLAVAAAPGIGGAASNKLVAKLTGEATNQNGAVRLTASGSSLLVEIHVPSAPAGPEPADLRHGSCSKIGTVAKPLSALTRGDSSTTLQGLTLTTIRRGTYAVLVHASAADLTRYVSCGDVGRGARLTDDASMKGFGGRPGI